MNTKQIRQTFLDFFESKQHKIVPSAPIVNKGDPTLLFTNAGMNQFKDFFLGHRIPPVPRIADTQKCLRVSGKHNDLEEVGLDSYHHTMFEMLGNWSFGDYFKEEAISWAWELLTIRLGLDPNRLYVTVFSGDVSENLPEDLEAAEIWERFLPAERVLRFGKKDNFWEMGDTGPCGPCSEIHYDIRDPRERNSVSALSLVNQGHPQVIEIWNLVFIQFNRKQDSSLELLPAKHVDTGMGFERLCMALQGKKSNYETDLFTPFIDYLQKRTGITYTNSYDPATKSDIAMRVISDHIRAVAFTIADGAMPGNTGAGYVIRRILRRAVRYYYSFLNIHEPLLHELVALVARYFEDIFPELHRQQEFVTKVILEEEKSFLRTLDAGLKRLENIPVSQGIMDGHIAFELYDTYGFPIDLTRLIAREKGWTVDEDGFEKALEKQRTRSKSDARKEIGDWTVLSDQETSFVGYDQLETTTQILKYRTVITKDGPSYQVVLSQTPFYAEGGGQVGDTGVLESDGEIVQILDTIRENDLFIHLLDKWPQNMGVTFVARVDSIKRILTENNHSATHLMHAALRKVLGDHVVQKGSLVNDQRLRFDFAHFQKMSPQEILQVEHLVNERIRQNITRDEKRSLPISEAKKAGAMMLFGEKYGENVRMITFDPEYSIELCGGCHVPATGQIGLFKIISESAISAGVRRIEAITALEAERFLDNELQELESVRQLFKNAKDVSRQVGTLIEENKALHRKIEQLQMAGLGDLKKELSTRFELIHGIQFLAQRVTVDDSKVMKDLIYQLEKEKDHALIILGAEIEGKPQLMVSISEPVIKDFHLHAGDLVKKLARHIQGGGGGQPFFASAGGKDSKGLDNAIMEAKKMIEQLNN